MVEHAFQEHLKKQYDLCVGNSASGLDLPSVNTDIKVTSYKQPQSSCPFKDSKQKIYGLGYNLLVFVYQKSDNALTKKGIMNFVSCTFIDKSRTADYQTTKAPIATIQVKADFSHAKGDFICYLGGHAHTPAHFEVTCQESPAPKQLMLLANTLSPEMQNNSYMYIKREKNALSSNSFSIYAIDTQEKNIYITSFGAKNNSVSAIETISYR